MRTRSIAVAAGIVALGATLLTPLSASAATVTVTGTVTGPNGPVAVDVQWYTPDAQYDEDGSGDYYGGVLSKASDGSFSLTIPSTVRDYYIVANLDEGTFSEDTGLAQRTDDSVVSAFYGAGDTHDELLATLRPYATPTATTLDIQLEGTGEIEGTSPRLAHADVYLVPSTTTDLDDLTLDDPSYGSDAIAHTTADGHGTYHFGSLVPGRFRVAAPTGANGGAGIRPWLSPVVEVTPGGLTEVASDVSQGAAVSGTVTVGSTPVSFAIVSASKAGEFLGYAISDSHGRFRLTGLPAGAMSLSVADYPFPVGSSAGMLPTRVVVTAVAGHSVTTAVHAHAGGQVVGAIDTDRTVGGYEGDVTVSVRSASGRTYGYYIGSSNPHGYRVRSLPAGHYTVYASASNGGRWGSASVVVSAGKRTVVPLIRMTRTPLTLTGTVPGATGGSVQVTHSGGYAFGTIDRTGHYTVRGVMPGAVAVYTSADGFATRSTSFAVSRSGTHTLHAGPRLGVIVAHLALPTVDSSGVEVSVVGSNDPHSYAFVDASGHLHFDVAPGTYRLEASPTSYSGISSQPGSPFVLSTASKPVTVRSGVVTNAGNLTVTVAR